MTEILNILIKTKYIIYNLHNIPPYNYELMNKCITSVKYLYVL